MGSVWDQYMDIYVLQGKKEGKKEAKEEGIEEGKIRATISLIESGAQKNYVSIEKVCEMFDLTYQDFKAELKAIEEQEALEGQEAAS